MVTGGPRVEFPEAPQSSTVHSHPILLGDLNNTSSTICATHHWNVMPTASVKLLVTVGLASRYHAWKFQVSPGCAAVNPMGVGSDEIDGEDQAAAAPRRLDLPR